MSFDELVIPEQPAVTLCIDNPKSSMEKRLSLRTLYFEVYYYKHFDWANSNYTRIKLEEGENELDGEIITFTKMQWCVSISTKNYHHVEFEERFIAISFLDLKSAHLDINTLEYFTFYAFFTRKENSYAIDNGHPLTEGEGHMVKIRRQFGNDVFAQIKLKPGMTNYIKEKSGCRDESFWNIIEPTFVVNVTDNCEDVCTPNGLPNSTLRFCKGLAEYQCAMAEFRKVIRHYKKSDSVPCTKIDYAGTHQIHHMSGVLHWV